MQTAKQGGRQVRATQTLSLPPELREIVIEKAEQSHGGNISRYIRKLVEADIEESDSHAPQANTSTDSADAANERVPA